MHRTYIDFRDHTISKGASSNDPHLVPDDTARVPEARTRKFGKLFKSNFDGIKNKKGTRKGVAGEESLFCVNGDVNVTILGI